MAYFGLVNYFTPFTCFRSVMCSILVTCLGECADITRAFLAFTSWCWRSYFKDVWCIGKKFCKSIHVILGRKFCRIPFNCYHIVDYYSVRFPGRIPHHYHWLPVTCHTLYILYDIWNLGEKHSLRVNIYTHIVNYWTMQPRPKMRFHKDEIKI